MKRARDIILGGVNMDDLVELIGKKIVSIRAYRTDLRKTLFLEPRYILFGDKKTILELEEQDGYSYHDCDYSARLLNIREDKKFWKMVNEDEKCYPKVKGRK